MKTVIQKLLAICAILSWLAPLAYAAPPNLITYQGRLKENSQPVTGDRVIEIILCNDPLAGACTSSGEQTVYVSTGLFKSTFTVPVDLAASAWYLQVKVGGIGGQLLWPREQLSSVPYAMLAATAAYVSGAVSKTGDTMTGSLALLGASTLTVQGGDFSVGASTFVVKGGNVGIGTNAPSGALHVATSDGYVHITRPVTAGDVTLNMVPSNGNARINNNGSGGGVVLSVASNVGLTLSSMSFVGIGNPTPPYKLHVSSGPGETGTIMAVSTGSTNLFWVAGNGAHAVAYYGDGSALSGVTATNIPASISISTMNASATTPYGGINIATNTFIQGNVGIGTTAPGSLLHVIGNASQFLMQVQNNTNTAQSSILFQNEGGANMLQVGAGNSASGLFPNQAFFNAQGGVPLVFAAGPSNNERMRITYAGNVGISSTTPAYRLVVSSGAGEAGTIMAVSTGTTDMFWVAGDGAHALKYYGDGSALTGVTASGAVLRGGDTMSGPLMIGSTLTIIAPDTAASSLWVSTSVTTPHLYVSTGGNVGIRNANPQDFLDVGSPAYLGRVSFYTGSLGLWNIGNTATAPPYYALSLTGTAPADFLLGEVSAGGNFKSGTTPGDIVMEIPGGNLWLLSADQANVLMFVNRTSGNVGIGGETNPQAKLDVKGAVLFGDAADVQGRLTYYGGTKIGIGSYNNYPVDIEANGVGMIRISTSGNVGIGTNTPTGLFQVGGGSLTVLANGNVGIGLTNPSAKLEVAGGVYLANTLDISGGSAIIQAPGGNLNLNAASGGDLTFKGNALAHMTIKNAGSVGVGTAAPLSKFDVMDGSITVRGANAALVFENSSRVISSETAANLGAGIRVSTNVYIVGFSSAAAYYGDGSALTGVTAAGAVLKAGDTMTGPLILVSSLTVAGNIAAARYQINGSTVLATLGGTGSLGVGAGIGALNTGDYNTFVGGFETGTNNTSGKYNVALGAGVLKSNSIGSYNTATGVDSLASNSMGDNNTVSGSGAAMYTQTGSGNSVFGYNAGLGVATNSYSSNTLVGFKSGFGLSTGSNNVFLGWQAGSLVSTGTRNIVIGYDANTSAPGAGNELNIGDVLYGDLAAKTIGISTRNPQAALDIVAYGTYAQIWRNAGGTPVASMTATGVFYGDGAGLTNIVSTGAVRKTGDTMLGALDMTGNPIMGVSTITMLNGSIAIVPPGTGGSNADYGISIGSNSYNSYSYGVGMGYNAYDNYSFGTGVGADAYKNYSYGVGLGNSAYNNYTHGVGVGSYASDNNNYGVGVGDNALGNSNYAVGIGASSKNNQAYGSAFGAYSYAASSSVALGSYTKANAQQSVAIGAGTVNNSTGTASFGVYAINTSSSITGAKYYGDGSTLSNVVSTSAVQKSGDTMLGALNMAGNPILGVSTITMLNGSIAIVPPGTGGSNADYGISIGSDTYNNMNYGLGVGVGAFGNSGYGVGVGASASGNYGSGLGIGVSASDNYSYGVGVGASAYGNSGNGVGVGYGANGNSTSGVGVGSSASANSSKGVGVGASASGNSNSGVGVGNNASGNMNYAVGIGAYSQNNGTYGSALGAYSYAASSATALGGYTGANAERSIALGYGTINNSTGTASFGVYSINTSSVITAAKYYGDASGLSNVVSTSAVQKTGDTMSGGLDMAGFALNGVSTITMLNGTIAIVPPGTAGSNAGYGISIGSNAYNNYGAGIGVGYGASGNFSGGVGVGYGAFNNSTNGVGVGYNAYANSSGGVGVGNNAFSNMSAAVGVGSNASGNSAYAVGIGAFSQNSGTYGSALGAYSYAASSSTALGSYAKANAKESIALGAGTVNNSTGTASFGTYSINTSSVITAAKYYGDGSGLNNIPGDGMGNHVATTTLQMGNYGINTSSDITAARYQINGSTVLAILPGAGSIAVGVDAGRNNGAMYNVFVGYMSNYSGSGGSDNTFVGARSGTYNTGFRNTFIGTEAGESNVGSDNAFVGYMTGNGNTAGVQNTFIGTNSGTSNTSGSNNVFVGWNAAYNTKAGSANTIIGTLAGQSIATYSFSSSTVMGYRAGVGLRGDNNILIGFQAGDATTTGTDNIVLGNDQDTSAPAASNELNIGGVLYGDLSAKTIGISTRNPQAALDIVSTGTASNNIYAQIWRDSTGAPVASMTVTGMLYGNGAGLSNIVSTGAVQKTGDTMTGMFNIVTGTLTVNNTLPSGHSMGFMLLADGTIISTGSYPGTGVQPISGSGERFMWIPGKAAIRAGGALGTSWDYSNIGAYSVAFGYGTIANGSFPSVLGGYGNQAIGQMPFAGGGEQNSSNADYAVVAGGRYNVISGSTSVITGGAYNTAYATSSFIGGGEVNTTRGMYSVVGGGRNNTGYDTLSVVGGGDSNYSGAMASFIGGGANNNAGNSFAAIAGGNWNKAWGYASAIGGGENNQAMQSFSGVGGGSYNVVTGSNSVIAGGAYNTVTGTSSVVSGGDNNSAAAQSNFIGGGSDNDIYSTLGSYSAIAGGQLNKAYGTATHAFIGGGYSNVLNNGAPYSVIGGGSGNTISGQYVVIGGGQNNSAGTPSPANYSVVSGGLGNQSIGDASFVGGGNSNVASGSNSVVPGGFSNTAQGNFSFAAGRASSSAANGAFTWADSQGAVVTNNVVDQVRFKASGGFWVSTSAVYSNPGLFVDSNNRVGIGTTTPGAMLDVVANTATPLALKVSTDPLGIPILAVSTGGVVAVNGELVGARMWQRIYYTELSVVGSSIVISGLSPGDKEFKLIFKAIYSPSCSTGVGADVWLQADNVPASGYDYMVHTSTAFSTPGEFITFASAAGSVVIGRVGQNATDTTMMEGTLLMSNDINKKQLYIGKSYLRQQAPALMRMDEVAGNMTLSASTPATQITLKVASFTNCLEVGSTAELWAFR